MDGEAQIKRIAAIWCRTMGETPPSSRSAAVRWVKREYGPVLDKERIDSIALRLIDEIKQQIRLRSRRKRNKPVEPLGPRSRDQRIGTLLLAAFGSARAWVARSRLSSMHDEECHYTAGGMYSGLLVGIIPVTMRLRRIVDPNMLVYRSRGCEPKSYWIPGYINDVREAFDWLTPPQVKEFLALDGVRVEHDGERQAVRLSTPYGTKVVPWRSITS